MKRLSQTLTMALLLGTTLNAAGYEVALYGAQRTADQPRGALVTATPAGQPVVTFNATNSTTSTALTTASTERPLPTVMELIVKANNSSAQAVWDDLSAMANAAADALNPELMLEIKRLQTLLLEQDKFKYTYPKLFAIDVKKVYNTFHKAMDQTVKDLQPERTVQLWRSLKTFMDNNGMNYRTGSSYFDHGHIIPPAILMTFNVAQKLGDIARALELWALQQTVLLESTFLPPINKIISVADVHAGFAKAAQKVNNLTELLQLWETQKAFLIANPSYCPSGENLIATTLTAKLNQEIVSAQKTGNTSRVAELEATKVNLYASLQTAPLPTIAQNPEYAAAIATATRLVNLEKSIARSQTYGDPSTKTIFSDLRRAFTLAWTSEDVPAILRAYDLNHQLSAFLQDHGSSSLGITVLDIAQKVTSFINTAKATNNPFRLTAACNPDLFRIRNEHLDPQLFIMAAKSFTPAFRVVQDLQSLDQIYATLVELEPKALDWLRTNSTVGNQSLYTELRNKLTNELTTAKAAYEEMKTKLSSLQLHTGDAAAAGSSRIPADEMSVRAVVARYGDMIDTGSLTDFKESFTGYYRIASVKLHPDKNKEASAEKLASNKTKFETLQRFKAWVDNLTEAEFATSPKQ